MLHVHVPNISKAGGASKKVDKSLNYLIYDFITHISLVPRIWQTSAGLHVMNGTNNINSKKFFIFKYSAITNLP